MLQSRKIRDQKGAAITGLVIALMFFMLIAGLFAFDASRVQMAQRELTATCDASALAGTAMLTSYDVSNDPSYTKLANAQQNAAAYAYNMFQMGNVLGRFLQGHCTPVSTLSALGTSTDGNCNVVLGLVDPKNSFATVSPSPPANANGRAIAVFAGYGYHPIFISFFGVGNVAITASSIGGLPQVDTVLVFDYSGSMDDLTKVTLVKRWWNANPVNGWTGAATDPNGWTVDATLINPTVGPTLTLAPQLNNRVPGLLVAGDQGVNAAQLHKGCIQYDEAPHPSGNQSLQNYVGLDLTNFLQGTSLNCLPPQNLANSELGTTQSGDQIIVFKQYLRHHYNTNDFASPPGNCAAFIAATKTSVVGDPYAYGDHMYQPTTNPGLFSNPPQTAWTTSGNPGALTSAHNYPSYSGRSGRTSQANWNNIYTDLVVNIKGGALPPTQPAFGDDVFAGCTATFPSSEDDPDIRSRSYTFPNLAVLVEASRGNLDSTANRNGTGLHRGYVLNAGSFVNTNTYQGANLNMTPQTGYQKAYQRMAMWYSQPIATSLDGADQGFFQKLSALCDCRFGFVGFSDSDPFQGTIPNLNSVATPHTGIWGGAQGTATYCGKNSYYYDVNFQQAATLGKLVWDGRHSAGSGGSGTLQRSHENNDTQSPSGLPGFRIPRTPLNTGITQSQSLNIITKGASGSTIPWSDPNSGDGLYNGRPQSGTMCYEAMETARRHFQNALYDGLSRAGSKRSIVFFTDGIPSGGVASTEATQTQGVADQCKTDGIAIYSIGLNMTGNPSLTADQNTFLGNGSAGLSGRAKNGGRYFECGSVDEVKQAFSAIARRLTQSQR